MGSMPLRKGKLQIFKILMPKLQATYQQALEAPSEQSIDGYKKKGGAFISCVTFLYRLEDLLTQLAQELDKLLKKQTDEQEDANAGQEQSTTGTTGTTDTSVDQSSDTEEETVEPTIEELLGPETQNFVMRFRGIFRNTSPLTRDVQTKNFVSNTNLFVNDSIPIIGNEEQNLLIRQIMKMTLNEAMEFVKVLKTNKGNIQNIRVALGAASQKEILTILLKVPAALLTM